MNPILEQLAGKVSPSQFQMFSKIIDGGKLHSLTVTVGKRGIIVFTVDDNAVADVLISSLLEYGSYFTDGYAIDYTTIDIMNLTITVIQPERH